MKKTIIIGLISILILNGFGAVAFSEDSYLQKTDIIFFNKTIVNKEDEHNIFLFEKSNSWINNPGYPLLPNYVKTYEFPFGTTIKNIDVTFSEPSDYFLKNDIVLASRPLTQLNGEKKLFNNNEISYKTDIFPEKEYSFNIGMGINNHNHLLILTIEYNPARYNFKENKVLFSEKINVKISYEPPLKPINFNDEYDMVIIAPKIFEKNIQPLIEHKNSHNVKTFVKTVEDIYSEYEGYDDPEKIKYFIRDALETYGINYVLLIGGMKGQRYNWYVPVRYSHLDDNSDWESSFISDLYYADIYDLGGNFSSWDTNENGVYAEWNKDSKDILDLYPDVCVGRLPCRNNLEVKNMVNKIIKYENKAYGKEWFNKMVVVGGDSAPGYEYYEGEEENKKALEYMQGFEGIRIWASNGNFTGVSDVVKAINGGCGFLFFDGHGNPSTWSTHPPDNNTWITGLSLRDIPKLINIEKLPVAVVGGCHNAQFNVTMLNIIKGILRDGIIDYFRTSDPYGDFWKREWVPECWAWHLVRKIGGGVISIMGYSGLDWFAEGDYNEDDIPDCIQFFSGFANTNFFKNYGVNNYTVLGEAYSQTLKDYITQFPTDWNVSWMDAIQAATILDLKTVEEFVLLGDPSLQIGGYEEKVN